MLLTLIFFRILKSKVSLFGICGCSGRKLHASAEGSSDELVDPPKVEEKIGAVPNGLSTDSDVVKRFVKLDSSFEHSLSH